LAHCNSGICRAANNKKLLVLDHTMQEHESMMDNAIFHEMAVGVKVGMQQHLKKNPNTERSE
jgi:hypothetical protein